MSGWIKTHRTMFEWEWYKDVPVKVLFFHLLMKANYEDNTYQGIIIKRGCLITGRRELSVETGLTEAQVRYALEKLRSTSESTKELILTTNAQGTHIQIVRYNEYQNNDEFPPEVQPADQPADQPANQPANQPLLKKEINKEVITTSEMNFTDQKNQIGIARDESLERWKEFTSLWKTTEDPEILNKITKKKYWDKLTSEIQKVLIDMLRNLGPDVIYLKNVWIGEAFKKKGMNTKYLKEKIQYNKNKNSSSNKDYLGSANNFTTNY
jgi:Fe-S oxidoreductase